MMNSSIGPDKGLLDALFGTNAQEMDVPAQATVPAEQVAIESGGEQAPVKADAKSSKQFSEILVQAQDQPVKTEESQPKGGSKQVLSQTAQPARNVAKAAVIEQAPKAQTTKKASEKEQSVEAAVASAAQAQQIVQTQQAQQQAPKAEVAAPKGEATKVEAPKAEVKTEAKAVAATTAPVVAAKAVKTEPVAQKPVAVKASVTQTPVAQTAIPTVAPSQVKQHDANLAANLVQAQLVASAPVNAKVQSARDVKQSAQAAPVSQLAEATVAQAPQAMAQPATVVQPIVIQMPIAVPYAVEVASIDDEDMQTQDMGYAINTPQAQASPNKAKPAALASGEDFLARMAVVNQPAQRALEGMHEKRERHEDSQNDSRNMMSVVLPHVGGTTSAAATSVSTVTTNTPVAASGPAVDVSNPMALAAQINGLAVRGGGAVRVRVAPENLGEMTIAVTQRGRKLDVQFEAGSAEARDALTKAMPELKQTLKASNYDVGGIEVKASAAQVMAPSMSDAISMTGRSSDFGQGGFGQQDRNQQWQGNQNNGQGSSRAWDRFFEQQNGQQYSGGSGRQFAGYRRYQQAEANL